MQYRFKNKSIIFWTCLTLFACSQESTSSKHQPSSPVVFKTLPKAKLSATALARVNGTDISSNCVQAQAMAHGLSKQAALQECIDFELLAQAAMAQNYISNEDAQEKAKQELVRSFIKEQAPLKNQDEVPDVLVQQLWEQTRVVKYNHPELRDFVFCRIPAKEDVTPAQDEKNRDYLQMVYLELKNKKDLTKEDLYLACYGDPDAEATRFAGQDIEELLLRTYSLGPQSRLQKEFQAPIFDSSKKSGQVIPPLQTEHGLDLILITQIIPEIAKEFSAVENELKTALYEDPIFEKERHALFLDWYTPFEKGMKVERFYKNIPSQPMAQNTERAKVKAP